MPEVFSYAIAMIAGFCLGSAVMLYWWRWRLRTSVGESYPVTDQQVMAHEIRTPLSLVKGAADLLQDESSQHLSKRQQQLLHTVVANTARAIDIAEGFLLNAKMGKPGFAPVCAQTDIRALTRSTVQELRNITAVPLLLTDPGDPLFIYADAGLLRQALWNLVGNAARHAGSGGRIIVSTYPTPHGAVLQIGDEGPGMTPEGRAQLFRPFSQFGSGASGVTAAAGTGIGMSITDRIVALHGGRIVVDTVADHGTSIYIILPWLEEGRYEPE